MNYQEALAYLDSLNTFGIKLGLVRITRLLKLLENPQNKYKTIHVTGTNGKGSTTAMLTSILTNAKIKTGMYTSPHLVSYTERMQIDGSYISENEFADCIRIVKEKVEEMIAEGEENPTQFEVITAAAFFYFAKMQVEYAVIEVGLGGLLDSTNVIIPEVSVITNVTLEHAERCGGTLEGVAEHKAGIIKDGVPVVTAAKGIALEIIQEKAREKNADVFVAGEDFTSEFKSFATNKQCLTFNSGMVGVSSTYCLGVLGEHQIENSSIAIMTALILATNEKRITSEGMQKSLSEVSWAGRFEVMQQENEQIMIIDGAHNNAGAEVFRRNLDKYFPHAEIVFLLGILEDKDVSGIIHHLIHEENVVVVTKPDSNRAAAPKKVAEMIFAKQVEAIEDIDDALKRAKELAANGKILCVAGSLYLIGVVRSLLIQQE